MRRTHRRIGALQRRTQRRSALAQSAARTKTGRSSTSAAAVVDRSICFVECGRAGLRGMARLVVVFNRGVAGRKGLLGIHSMPPRSAVAALVKTLRRGRRLTRRGCRRAAAAMPATPLPTTMTSRRTPRRPSRPAARSRVLDPGVQRSGTRSVGDAPGPITLSIRPDARCGAPGIDGLPRGREPIRPLIGEVLVVPSITVEAGQPVLQISWCPPAAGSRPSPPRTRRCPAGCGRWPAARTRGREGGVERRDQVGEELRRRLDPGAEDLGGALEDGEPLTVVGPCAGVDRRQHALVAGRRG